MTDVLDMIRDQRPHTPSLDPATRERIRVRFSGGSRPADQPTADVGPQRAVGAPADRRLAPGGDVDVPVAVPEGGPDDRDAHRFWASIAAIVVVAIGLASLIWVVTRPSASAPSEPTPVTVVTATTRPFSPDTVPVVEEMPDTFTSSTRPTAGAGDAGPTAGEPAVIPAPTFTRLLLAQPPDGFVLTAARYTTDGLGIGIARYAHPDHDTRLEILILSRDSMFDGLDERPRWEIGGREFVDDNEVEGCLRDVCSIGAMWDDHTYVSLRWVLAEPGELVAGADRDRLVELAAELGEHAEAWLPITDEIELETLGDGVDGGTEALLRPPGAVTVESAAVIPHGPAGTQSVALRAPDGTMQALWQTPNAGAAASPDARSVGTFEWSADASGQVTLYRAALDCSTVTIGDGGGGTPWREATIDLLSSISLVDGTTVVELPSGWTRLGGASGELVYSAVFSLELAGPDGAAVTTAVVFDQSPGTSGGAIPDTAVPLIESAIFRGHDAWIATDPAQPEFVGVAWFDGLTSHYVALTAPTGVDATGLVDGLERELDAWGTATAANWSDRVGADPPAPSAVSAGDCGAVPRLLVLP